jgi:hypothetical protein
MQPLPKKLLDQVREAIRLKHYAYHTEETYVQWIHRYIIFQAKLNLEVAIAIQ